MVKHLYSKIALFVYLLVAAGLFFWGYSVFKQRDGKVVVTQKVQNSSNTDLPASGNTNNASSSDVCTEPSTCSNGNESNSTQNTDENSPEPVVQSQPISPSVNVNGPMLAHITPEHCNSGCRAFASDLALFEYCQEVCGISPIKYVTNCDGKKDIQKDYCLKDLSINNNDNSICQKIKDANIKETCQSWIEQNNAENLRKTQTSQGPID